MPDFIIVGIDTLVPQPKPASAPVQAFYPAETELLRAPRLWRDYRLVRALTRSGYFAYFARREDS